VARRNPLSGVVTGLSTILGRLAQFFRLGTFGAVQPGETAEPGRERLRTPAEITAAVTALGELPPAAEGARVSRSYLCTWTDEETGEHWQQRVQVETPEGVAAITATTAARQLARLHLPRCVQAGIASGRRLTMRCRQLGAVTLPPAST